MNDRAIPLQGDRDTDELDAVEKEGVAGEPVDEPGLDAEIDPDSDADELSAEIRVTRWHPIEQDWKDASIPLPRTPEEEDAEYAAREAAEAEEAAIEGEHDWLVVVHSPGRDEAVELADRLRREGVPVARRWRYVRAGALTEERAEELAERLRRELSDDVDVFVEANLSDVRLPAFQFLTF